MDLLDRERERAAIGGLLDAARAGRGGAVVLRGEQGVGLSALLEHAAGSAAGMRTVRMRGVKPERELGFAAVHQLCASMLDRRDAPPEPQRESLASALSLIEERADDPLRLGLAVLAVLSSAAQDEPLLCVIDDAQWLDAPSAETMAFVARRLERERIAFVLALHHPLLDSTPFAGLGELEVAGLPPNACRKLLESVVSGPLDGGVRDRLIADTAGNPLALLQLSRRLRPGQLAGLSGLPAILPLGEAMQRRFLDPAVGRLPSATRMLLVLAAAGYEETTSVLWSAAASLGLAAEAAAPAEEAGLLRLGERIEFRHPLLRLAIYDSATVVERQRVHRALAEALDPVLEFDRRATHRAAASLTPDEDVAAELEEAAARAKGRGDYAVAAALLERAAGLTPDADRRYGRTLAAGQSALAAGSLGRAASLVDAASAAPLDELKRTNAQRLRGAISVALGQGSDRATVLLRAASALAPADARLARDSYLAALEAAVCAGRFGSARSLIETAEAGHSAPRIAASEASVADQLLDGIVLLITAGHGEATAAVRRAIEALRHADEPRWLPLGVLAALEIWDDEAVHELTSRQAELTPVAGAPATLPFGLSHLGDLDAVVAGRFGPVASAAASSPGELIASAWLGRAKETRDMAEASMRDAFARELGLHVAFGHLAVAILELGLGAYEPALTAARAAHEEPGLCVATSALPELIEAAVRSGERELAVTAVGQLSERANASGTHWALGTLARSRALLEAGGRADELYREAIERLRRSRAAPQLARAHLVYGEWLRRERRRREAREQLRTARDMFVFMGAQAFAERARGELTATGEHARRRSEAPEDLLTEQEARIARLVCDGATNATIAAQLFISTRTVEYHLHKAFRKLGVSSRTQLARVLLESDEAAG
jgi:DNA-binding CsgD family transcriptional regulator